MDGRYRTQRDDHREALLAATVRISTRGADGLEIESGTGFFVTENWVLTASHVVPAGRTPYVECQGIDLPAKVLDRQPQAVTSPYDVPDVALLKVGAEGGPVPDHGCIELADLEPENNDELFVCGWPLIDGQPMLAGMAVTYAGWRHPNDSPLLFVTKGGQVQPGTSGAAAIHLERGVVAGIVKLSRGVDWDAGAVLLPTKAIFAALSAEPELADENQRATASVNSREALYRRLGRMHTRVRDTLASAQPEWRRSMLDVLEGRSLTPVTADDLALKLLGLRLEQLGGPLKILAYNEGEVRHAERLLRDAACCAWVQDRPWVAPRGAALLAEHHKTGGSRIVHVPCTQQLTGKMYVGRAATQRDWNIVELAPPDAEPDPETGLPAGLLHSIRAELLHNTGADVDVDDEEAVRELWSAARDEALAEADELFLVLPPGTAEQDAGLLSGLLTAFPGCTFAIFAPRLAAALGSFSHLLPLPASLPLNDEERAEKCYRNTVGQLRNEAKK